MESLGVFQGPHQCVHTSVRALAEGKLCDTHRTGRAFALRPPTPPQPTAAAFLVAGLVSRTSMAPNDSLEELAAVRKAAREEKERRRLERKAARLASKHAAPRAGGTALPAPGPDAGAAAAALAAVRPLSKAEKKAAIKEAKQRRREAKKAAAAAKEDPKSPGASALHPAGRASGATAGTTAAAPAPRGKKRGFGAMAKQLERERQKKSKGVLMKHGKYDYGGMAGGKISQEELAQLRGETVEQAGYSTKLIGFTLGWSKTNGGFGSKADTIARDARTQGTVGRARSME